MNTIDEKIKLRNKLSLLDQLLDDRCEMFGIKNTIAYLLDSGMTEEEIIELGFDERTVAEVAKNPDADYDFE